MKSDVGRYIKFNSQPTMMDTGSESNKYLVGDMRMLESERNLQLC